MRALEQLESQALSPLGSRWLAALTLGADEQLASDDWDLLNASGTTHLMVISGLHVGLVATVALLMARGIARNARARGAGGWPCGLVAGRSGCRRLCRSGRNGCRRCEPC
ncbi:hypothetical protein DSL92_04525 [Billgrantia gudaonensis]|uniref:ComEC/Rec2-related protein domain-containing protein n=1 Tax=Billgrantia gudaonensis TaxID=376427 RepID=A0A432JJI2_9GAMM|nr:hypothetical protein DSL92_04525 [Halomonas gudaonensis]